MRFKVTRLLGTLALFLLYSVMMPGCSGSQEDQEGLEVSQESSEESSEQSSQEDSDQDDQMAQEGDEDSAYEDGEDTELSDEMMDDGEMIADETESDLEEIINEMNGEATLAEDTQMGDSDATALQGDLAMDQTGTESSVGMDSMAAAPAAAPVSSGQSAIPFQPGGSPAGAGLPELGSKMPYVVQQGDTLAKISGRIYQDASRWREMADLTGLANPSRIYPGDIVYYTLDEQSLAFASTYESLPKMEEQVQPGDTLASISQRVYGNSRAWKTIWRQNDTIENPDVVEPGTVVYYIQASGYAFNQTDADVQLAKAKISTEESVISDAVEMESQENSVELSDVSLELPAEGHVSYTMLSEFDTETVI